MEDNYWMNEVGSNADSDDVAQGTYSAMVVLVLAEDMVLGLAAVVMVVEVLVAVGCCMEAVELA